MNHLPLYSNAKDACLQSDSHGGLWFERFYNAYDKDWKTDEAKTNQKEWLEELSQKPHGEKLLIEQHIQAIQRRILALGGEYRDMKAPGCFVTGMGLAHPLENGLLWHPTLGTPYLNGAAVKGLLRAFFEQWTEIPASQIHQWFGQEENKHANIKTYSGDFIFFDALPLKPVTLKIDVITPHYGKWYADGQKITGTGGENIERLPADWHNPIPVPFLVTHQIELRFAIAPRRPRQCDHEALQTLLEGLVYALEWLGAGAKTAVGYGRMAIDAASMKQLEQDKAKQELQQRLAEEARQKAQAEALEIKRREALDPIELKIEDIFRTAVDKSLPDWQKLHQSLIQNNVWLDTEKSAIATRIRTMMEAAGVWVPDEKSKKGERSRQILKVLEN